MPFWLKFLRGITSEELTFCPALRPVRRQWMRWLSCPQRKQPTEPVDTAQVHNRWRRLVLRLRCRTKWAYLGHLLKKIRKAEKCSKEPVHKSQVHNRWRRLVLRLRYRTKWAYLGHLLKKIRKAEEYSLPAYNRQDCSRLAHPLRTVRAP